MAVSRSPLRRPALAAALSGVTAAMRTPAFGSGGQHHADHRLAREALLESTLEMRAVDVMFARESSA